MSKKLTIGILCGGKSAEHEVSLQSAKNIYDAIDRERYNPILIGINKTGKWLLDESRNGNLIRNAGDPKNIHLGEPGEGGEGKEVALVPASGGQLSLSQNSVSFGRGSRKSGLKPVFSNKIKVAFPKTEVLGKPQLSGAGVLPKLDAVFPILHGPFGEDGTVQGLLKCAGLPFVGAGVLGSAVSMDKDVMKRLLRDGGVPIGKFLAVNNSGGAPSFADAALALGQPVFVKPANMGSSIGVSKVNDEAAYRAALVQAFRYDTKVILEENIPGRELECSVLGNEAPAASLPGEIRAARDFYSYQAKYIDPDGAVLDIPAKLPEALTGTVQALAIKTFQVLECRGLARVDFFLRENGEVLVNEINTMPGFTNISMYPKLWEASGVPYSELIHRLICFAIEQFEQERKLSTSCR